MNSKSAEPKGSLAYAWFVVGVLMLAYVFSFVDRQILSLLVGPIRKDLGISDTEMSLLIGASFAVFYTFCGIPLGRLADSRSRRGIITVGLLVWSLATAACGLANRYWQLFLCRIGVGVGEAALSPAAYSLITDYFPKESRATAISVYSMGIYLGSGIAFLVGGLVINFAMKHGPVLLPLIGEIRPWQVVFLILGAAGILFSAALLSVREPARGAGGTTPAPVGEVLAHLRRNWRTVLCHNFGFAMISFSSYGAAAWITSYFVRVRGWAAGDFGQVYGYIIMVFGCSGIVFGGRLADWLARKGHTDATMRVGLYAACASIPLGGIYILLPDANWAVAALAPAVFCLSMPFGVAPAGIQEIMPPNMRGQASALYLFIVNLIGLGLGPTAIAVVTDYVFHDDNAVGMSMLLVGAAAQLTAVVLLRAGLKPFRDSMSLMNTLKAA